MKVARILIYMILTATTLASTSMANVTGLVQGQIFQTECGTMGQTTEDLLEVDPGATIDPFWFEKELQQRSNDFRNGCRIGTVLGFVQGNSDSYNNRTANAEASVNDACAAFEDYYGTRCVLPNNFHSLVPYLGNGTGSMAAHFVQGYLNAYPDAYDDGYYAGYYLDKTIDQRYALEEPESVNEETIGTYSGWQHWWRRDG
jgi:hypothetical protein